MKYMATLYLTPDDAEAALSILSFQSNGKELTFTIENTGNLHKILVEPKLTFAHDDKKIQFGPSELPGVAGENVLGNSRRIFTVKSNKVIPANSKATIKVND